MAINMQNSKICLFFLCVICAGAFLIRADGIKWPKLHPDEPVIGAWIEQSAQHIYIKDRVYPNGFFMLARPFVLAGRALTRLNERFDYNCGMVDHVRDIKPDGIYFGRWFNAWAGTFLCVIMFLFVARMTRSQWAGLFAACLTGFSQYAVEHSHYAETDVVALVCLVIALWLWVIAHDSANARWFGVAAFVSGFAAGTKFTLAALGVLVIVESFLFARRRLAAGRWTQAVGTVCLGFLFFGVGFVCANPAVVLDFKWFWAGMAAEQGRVFAETMLNLGPLGAQPGVKYLHHLWCFCSNASTLGLPWLALILVGLFCVMLGEARRHWPALILFPAMFAFYWIFTAPWVRSQEFLFFLPSFAALGVLPLVVLWRSKYVANRALVIIFAVMALTANGRNGLRVAGLFGWKDTRIQAMEWLQVGLPLESRIVAESYAEAGCPATLNLPLAIKKIEREGIKSLTDRGADYLLRAAGVTGRGLRHPLTGELYPGPADNLRQFMAGSTLLCSWAPLPPQGAATFVSPMIELYGMKHFAPAVSLRAELPQPALIVNGDQNPVGRQTFSPVGHELGCARALLIDRRPQTIAVGGPDQLSKPVYLVLNTAERPAVINIRGFGARHKIALEPYDIAVVPLQRSAWRPGAEPFEKIIMSAEPFENVVYIPCFARIAFTVSEAARICLDTGREDKIAGYFPEDLLERELSPDLKYIIGARLGLGAMAARNKPSADSLRNAMEQRPAATNSSISINGVNGYYYEQFARARLQQPYELACRPQREEYARAPLQNTVKIMDLLPDERQGGRINKDPKNPEYYQTLTLPVLLARGKYELRGEVMLRLKETKSDTVVPLTVFVTGETDVADKIELQPGQWSDFSMILQPGREIQPRLELRAPVAVQVHLRNMEIVWSLDSALDSVHKGLVAAGQPNAKPAGKPPPEAGCGLKNQPVFTPWLALVGFNFDPGTREAKCVFAALRDNTPKLAVTFWLQRHGEWRRKQVQAISAKQWLSNGEREVVIVRLDEALGESPDINKLGLGVETDVLWHPGAIPLATGGHIVPFASIMEPTRQDQTGK